jgi:hypothetical protein
MGRPLECTDAKEPPTEDDLRLRREIAAEVWPEFFERLREAVADLRTERLIVEHFKKTKGGRG